AEEFRAAGGKIFGMGVGCVSLRRVFSSGADLADVAGDAAAGGAVPAGSAPWGDGQPVGMGGIRAALGVCRADRAYAAFRSAVCFRVGVLSATEKREAMGCAGGGVRDCVHSGGGAVVCAQLPAVPPIYSVPRHDGAGMGDRQ